MKLTWRCTRRLVAVTLVAAATMFTDAPVFSAAAVTIWPINPVITDGARATAVWLENTSSNAVTMQIRVLRWSQDAGIDKLEDAEGLVIASPPLATIAPGRRQLVRLVSTVPAPAGRELAFRILIDELPNVGSTGPAAKAPEGYLGVTFRMRYSVPLFVYGRGLAPRLQGNSEEPVPLTWWVAESPQGPALLVRNPSERHVRLSKARLVSPRRVVDVAPGLLGYVLPGTEMRWLLPPRVDISADDVLEVIVNHTLTTIPRS
jgi:fimbrial chaperone protein